MVEEIGETIEETDGMTGGMTEIGESIGKGETIETGESIGRGEIIETETETETEVVGKIEMERIGEDIETGPENATGMDRDTTPKTIGIATGQDNMVNGRVIN